MAGNKMTLDFTNVKDGGGAFRKTRQEAGDYRGEVTKVATVKKKDGSGKQWLFTIKAGSGIYPYYCGFEENVLWKIRNIFVAAGFNVPKKKVAIDPEKLVGKKIAVTLGDDEYDGKLQSNIEAVFPLSELEDDGTDATDDTADDEDEEDEDTSTATDDDDEEEEDEEPEPPVAKKKKKAKKAKAEDDDEMEELDIEDI
jgi:hypothetical protein